MKSILVAADFSKIGDHALAYAVNKAYRNGARLVLFTLHCPAGNAVNSSAGTEVSQQWACRQRERLSYFKDRIKDNYAISVEFHPVCTDFLSSLKGCITQYFPTELVIGMEKKSFEHNLLDQMPFSPHDFKALFPLAKTCLIPAKDPDQCSIEELYVHSEILLDSQFEMLVKIKNFAQNLGARIDAY